MDMALRGSPTPDEFHWGDDVTIVAVEAGRHVFAPLEQGVVKNMELFLALVVPQPKYWRVKPKRH